MQSDRKLFNCIPCAKRKVRCDRGRPCQHCRRRKGDSCIYPTPRTSSRSLHAEQHASGRVEQLEDYVKRLGGDPKVLEQIAFSQTSRGVPYSTPIYPSGNPQPVDAKKVEMQSVHVDKPWDHKHGLAEHDDQVTYTEVPMWYSWSGVKKQEAAGEAQAPPQEQSHRPKPKTRHPHCFPTLLDPTSASAATEHNAEKCPSGAEIIALWRQYLTNVHQLVMIFFDWEAELIIRRASLSLTTEPVGEQTFVLAISLIATLSLTEEQCLDILHEKKAQALIRLQKAVEGSLTAADFMVTSDRFVLQAFMLYLMVMQTRARPAVVFSLLGIASRIAERMGLHRDGDELGLPVMRSEERRRMWWQLQHLEIAVAQLVGSITMTIYADWNTKLPSNLEDRDLHADTQTLPPGRRGLTSMSHCLWHNEILYLQRVNRGPDGKIEGMGWLTSPHVPLATKDAKIDVTERTLNEKFLQYCEPLDPLHTLIQIGVRSFVLSARRVCRQPALVNAKITEMSLQERNEFLKICMKTLEYYVLLQTTESLRKFQWHLEIYSQWPSLVYIILEAHHRYDDDAVEEIWSLIGRVYDVHPKLKLAIQNPDVVATVHITLAAWQRRHSYLQHQPQRMYQLNSVDSSVAPAWISELRQKFDIPEMNSTPALDTTMQGPLLDASQLLPFDFDFNSMDLSFWDSANMDESLYDFDL